MAKIKNTKTELKSQTDALKRYQRFLPMLQLKKQQLQCEIASITLQIESLEEEEKSWRAKTGEWTALFASQDVPGDLAKHVLTETETGNIAGVPIPVFKGVKISKPDLDLFETPHWFDDAQEAIGRGIAFGEKKKVLVRQRSLVEDELRATSQRVNLFEKVKIPECKENIRIIRIHLGDESTAAVARGKIAKKRSV